MEDYAAKMALKPDAALREYVTGYAQYREAAVLAAFDELRRRGQPAPEEAALRPGLEVAARAQREAEAAAEAAQAQAEAAADPESADAEGPVLYSPGTIVLFSVLFTLLAGGVLLGLNFWRLGRKKALLGLVLFIVGYLLLGALALAWALPRYGLQGWFAPLFNLPAVLAYVLWFWPRYVGTGTYRSRGWLPPLVVCVLLVLGMQKANKYLIERQPKEVRQELERLMPREPAAPGL
jgi:hypothetical protein